MRYERAKKDEKEVVHRRDGARYPTGKLRIAMRLNRLPEYESAGSARGCYTYSWRMGPESLVIPSDLDLSAQLLGDVSIIASQT